jgi:hypothetical protein
MAERLRIICISALRFVVTKNVGKGKEAEKKETSSRGKKKHRQRKGGKLHG